MTLSDLRRRLGDESGVFIPALMGAGILTSIFVLVMDGARKVLPLDGARARSAHVRAGAEGRVADLDAAATGIPPHVPRAVHVPRGTLSSTVLAGAAGSAAWFSVQAAYAAYYANEGVLSDRGWTLAMGFGIAVVLAALSVVWLATAVARDRGPRLLRTAARLPVVGTFPSLTPPDDSAPRRP